MTKTLEVSTPLMVEQVRKEIYLKLEQERARQVALGHDAEHDAQMTEAQWIAVMTREIGLSMGQGGVADDQERFLRQMYRLGAVVLAIIESKRGIRFEGNAIGPTEEQRGKGY